AQNGTAPNQTTVAVADRPPGRVAIWAIVAEAARRTERTRKGRSVSRRRARAEASRGDGLQDKAPPVVASTERHPKGGPSKRKQAGRVLTKVASGGRWPFHFLGSGDRGGDQ